MQCGDGVVVGGLPAGVIAGVREGELGPEVAGFERAEDGGESFGSLGEARRHVVVKESVVVEEGDGHAWIMTCVGVRRRGDAFVVGPGGARRWRAVGA